MREQWIKEAEETVEAQAKQFKIDFEKAVELGYDLEQKLPAASKYNSFIFKPNSILLCGFTFGDGHDLFGLPGGWETDDENTDGFRIITVNEEKMLVLTYCEGDVTLEMYKDRASFEAGEKERKEWYKEWG